MSLVVPTMSEICSVCTSKDITDLGREFTHFEGIDDYRKSVVGEKLSIPDPEKNHVMCDDCLKDFIRVCTCDKEFKTEPKTLSLLCSCEGDNGSSLKRIYFDISHKFFLELLSNWRDDYYIIEGCRGCRFGITDIQTKFDIGLKAAVEACVYKQFNIDENDQKYSAMAYQSDALDDDFVKSYSKICESFGWEDKLGSGTDL